MTTKCPNCQIDLDVPTEYLGCKVECPDCGHKFIVGNQPTRVPIPPQQPKKKSGGKKIPKWVFIVIPAALLFSIAAGFIVPMILNGNTKPKNEAGTQEQRQPVNLDIDKLTTDQLEQYMAVQLWEAHVRILEGTHTLVISDAQLTRKSEYEFTGFVSFRFGHGGKEFSIPVTVIYDKRTISLKYNQRDLDPTVDICIRLIDSMKDGKMRISDPDALLATSKSLSEYEQKWKKLYPEDFSYIVRAMPFYLALKLKYPILK